ncbi:MAG: hypothetical protein J6R85_06485, partial [Lentisphaeria bacterium]|nr:hypothetical protein [Lentisphaeria bacterium]
MLKIEQLTKTLMVAACGVSALQLAAVEAEQVAKDTVPRHMVASQETESQAEALVRKANDLFVNGKFDEARETYLDAKIIFQKFNSQIFADKVRFCDDRVKECYFQKARAYFDAAQKKANDENFDKAIEYYNEALKCYPECEAEVRPLIQQLEKRKAASALRRSVSTETLIPERGNQLYQIQVLLRQGQEFVKIGEFDKAVQKYNEILLIDPYNAEAIHNLKAANIRSSKVAKERYKNTHHKMAAEIEWKWARNISYEGSAAAENQVDAPIEKETANDFGDISQKLRSIIIPRIDFDDITVPAALRFLQTESKRNDPEQKGVNIFLRRPPVLDAQQNMGMDPAMDPGMDPMLDPTLAPDPAMAADPAQDPGAAVTDPNAPATQDIMERRVSMTSTKMSLYDVLQLLCKEMKLRMRIDRHAVVLAPENVALDDLETKVFPLDKSVFSDFDPEKENAKLVDFFKNYGVQFPQGAKIVYDARLSRLIAYNTLDNLREIDSAIQEIQNENEPMVEITAKFIEVSQNDLKEMGFDYSVSYNAANKPESNSSYSSHRLSFDNSLSG